LYYFFYIRQLPGHGEQIDFAKTVLEMSQNIYCHWTGSDRIFMDRVISCEWLKGNGNDPRPDLEEETLKDEEYAPSLEALGCDTGA